jgi:hypothetical protein
VGIAKGVDQGFVHAVGGAFVNVPKVLVKELVKELVLVLVLVWVLELVLELVLESTWRIHTPLCTRRLARPGCFRQDPD